MNHAHGIGLGHVMEKRRELEHYLPWNSDETGRVNTYVHNEANGPRMRPYHGQAIALHEFQSCPSSKFAYLQRPVLLDHSTSDQVQPLLNTGPRANPYQDISISDNPPSKLAIVSGSFDEDAIFVPTRELQEIYASNNPSGVGALQQSADVHAVASYHVEDAGNPHAKHWNAGPIQASQDLDLSSGFVATIEGSQVQKVMQSGTGTATDNDELVSSIVTLHPSRKDESERPMVEFKGSGEASAIWSAYYDFWAGIIPDEGITPNSTDYGLSTYFDESIGHSS